MRGQLLHTYPPRPLEWIKERVERKEEGTRILIGDFNVRTGEKDLIEKREWVKEWKSRRLKDIKLNAEERVMVKWMEEIG